MKLRPFSKKYLPPFETSGIYAIATPGGRIVYVGESHTGRLRKTFLRHFQAWTGKTAGPTYGRDSQVYWLTTPKGKAVQAQNALIRKHRPRDNETAKPKPTFFQAVAAVIDDLNPF